MSLELGRREGESIVFPTLGIEISVRNPKGKQKRGRVRLGVQAPRDVPVLRGELCQGRPIVKAERAGSALYRVVWCDGAVVRITTLAPYWTAVQAQRRLAAEQCVAEVVADTAASAALAAAIGVHCCEVMAGVAQDGRRGERRQRDTLQGWAELATVLGAVATGSEAT